ncbi:MAG: phage baseplate assembly protein V [Gemmatimonadota bacterium]
MRVILTVEIGEQRLLKTELERLEVVQTLGDHTRCSLEFIRDRGTDLTLEHVLGQTLTVSLEDDDGGVVVFEGDVTRASQSHLLNYGSRFVVEGASRSHRLSEHRGLRYFNNRTFAEIVAELGATLVGEPPDGSPLNYVQLGESEFDFLVRLADDHGFHVRNGRGGLEVCAGFAEEEIELVWGRDLLEVHAEVRPVNPGTKGAFYQADEKKDHRFHGVRRPPEWLGGGEALTRLTRDLAARVAGGGDPLVVETASRTPTLADYRTRLEQESERAQGTAVRVRGQSTQIRLCAGARVHLRGSRAFRLPTEGVFGLVEVIHRFDGQQYTNTFVATPWARFTGFHKPDRRPAAGVVTAVVVANDDPAGQGRIRVRYGWQDEPQHTGWVRVASLHAGNGRGVHWIPEIGDEVLVAFEQADPERPVVIGSLWNGKDAVPQVDAANDVKTIATRSGNTIRLVDTADEERIEIWTAGGLCLLRLANDADGVPTVTVHSEGDLALEAAGEIRMVCARLVQQVSETAHQEVEGDLHLKVSGTLNAEAEAGLKMASAADTVLGASGVLHLNASGEANLTGSRVKMNPSGYSAPSVTAEAAPERPLDWEPQPVPVVQLGRSSADPATPRLAE